MPFQATSTKNQLTAYRRHITACGKTGPTHEPQTKLERKSDSCDCPIVVSGYLEKHSGRIRHLSLDTNDWTEAAKRKAVLLERQCLIVPDVPTIAAGVLTVEAAVERYIESRGEAGTEPLHHDTLENYKKLLRCRLLDFCKENGGITELRSLEDVDFIRRFTESWRNLNPQRTQADVLLDDYTKFV